MSCTGLKTLYHYIYIYIYNTTFVSLDRKENKYIVSTQTNTLTHRESILRARVDFESKESGLSGSKVTWTATGYARVLLQWAASTSCEWIDIVAVVILAIASLYLFYFIFLFFSFITRAQLQYHSSTLNWLLALSIGQWRSSELFSITSFAWKVFFCCDFALIFPSRFLYYFCIRRNKGQKERNKVLFLCPESEPSA